MPHTHLILYLVIRLFRDPDMPDDFHAHVDTTPTPQVKDVVIVSVARTPIGKFCGPMTAVSGPNLSAIAVREAVARAGGPR